MQMAWKIFLKQPQNHEPGHAAGSICRCAYTDLNCLEIWKQSHKTGQNRTWPHNKSEAKRKKLEIKVKRSKDARLETETDIVNQLKQLDQLDNGHYRMGGHCETMELNICKI